MSIMNTNAKNIVSLAEDRVQEARVDYNKAVFLNGLLFSEGSNTVLPVAVVGVEFLEAVDFAAACLLYHGNVQVDPVINSLSYYMVSSNGFESSSIGAIDL